MPTVPLPLFTDVYKNLAQEELNDKSAELMDGFVDDEGYIKARPGQETIVTFSGVSSTAIVDGEYWWDNKQILISVCEGKVFKTVKIGGVYTTTNITGATLNVNSPVSFASDGNYVFMANGGQIIYTDGTINSVGISDPNAPTVVTALAWIDGYLLANEVGTNRFRWSNVNTPLTWGALNFASASGNSDNIVNILVKDRLIYLFGTQSLELWENDGASPFIRISGGFLGRGVVAPYSVVDTKAGLLWIDDQRNIVKFNGRSVEKIATQYDAELQALTTISDALGFAFTVGGYSFGVFQFPTANRTFVLSQNNNNWSEWGAYNSSTGLYAKWRCNSIAFATAWGEVIIGCNCGPYLHRTSFSALSDNENPIRVRKLTGHIDYGEHNRKRSERITLRMKRGVGLSTRTPKLELRWRTDNKDWSNIRSISAGDIGNSEIVVKLFNLGIYRTRQYEFVMTDPVPMLFGNALETFTVLG